MSPSKKRCCTVLNVQNPVIFHLLMQLSKHTTDGLEFSLLLHFVVKIEFVNAIKVIPIWNACGLNSSKAFETTSKKVQHQFLLFYSWISMCFSENVYTNCHSLIITNSN